MITIDALECSYGKKDILKGVSMQMDPGEVYCLVGENGAGKTTLLESLLGLKIPSSGHILFDGQPVDKIKKQLGVVYQENFLLPRLKVKEELAAYSDYFQAPASWVKHLVTSFELAPLMNKIGNNLSGGERRRVLIALAFLNQPKYIILDEPFTGIDTKLRMTLRRFISDYAKEQKAVVLFSEHNILECQQHDYWFYYLFEGGNSNGG